ncbi:MAG: efflux RND transporter periplasmic adaptor subunit [Moorellales bacterium]
MQPRKGVGVKGPERGRGIWAVAALLALAVLVGVGSAGCGLGGGAGRQEEGREAVAVEVAAVERGDLVRQVEFAGQVRASQEISVAAKAQGQVQEVLVDIGDRVRAGQVLARLDATDLEAQLRSAEAGVRTAESALAMAEAGPSEAQLKMLQAQVAQAEADWKRIDYLYREGAVSQQQWEQARTAYEVAKASLENAYPRPEQIKQLEAQVEQARAQAEALRLQLRHYVVTSPLSGVITSRSVDPGSLASPGVPLFTVSRLDPVVVELVVGENEVNFLEVGRQVEVVVPAAGEKPFTGRVAAVSPGLDARLGGYRVKVEMGNPQGVLKPGMAARVRLSLEKLPGRLLVPLGALVDRGHGAVVFVVQADRAVERPVEVEATGEGRAALRSGVQEGDKVVVKGQEFLQTNDPVRVVAAGRGEKP